MCEICNKEFAIIMATISKEYCKMKGLEFNLDNVKTFADGSENEFHEYTKKRIPEIVAERPVFKVMEIEYSKEGEPKVKNISYT